MLDSWPGWQADTSAQPWFEMLVLSLSPDRPLQLLKTSHHAQGENSASGLRYKLLECCAVFCFIIINLVNPLPLLKILPVALTTLGLGMFIWLGPLVSPRRSLHNQKKWENGLLRLAPCIIYQESCSLSSPWKKQMRQLGFVPTDPNRPKHRQSFF